MSPNKSDLRKRYSGLLAGVSIKRKLIFIFMIISSIVVLLTSVTIAAYQLTLHRKNMVDSLMVQAKMISENCLAALSFDDPEDAKKILGTLHVEPSIAYAAVYRLDGTLFASYRRWDFSQKPLPPPGEKYVFAENWLLVRQPALLDGRAIGFVFLQSSLQEISSFMRKSVVASGFIVVGVLLLALAISARLQRVISGPALLLTKVTETISRDKDYSIRADISSRDEFGTLTKAFNNMLEQVENKDLAMRQMRNFLKNIIDSMPSALIGVDIEGHVTQWNREAEKLTGMPFEKAEGRNIVDVIPRMIADMEVVQGAIRKKKGMKNEKMLIRIDGENRYLEMTIYPLIADGVDGAVIRIDDVTEKTRIEEMMVQTEKMISVGGLAAGMAHEINNPLSGIVQGIQNITRRLSNEFPQNEEDAAACGTDLSTIRQYLEKRNILKFLDTIQDSGLRAARIVRNMLQFSRRNESQLIPANLTELINGALDLASSDFDLSKKYDFKQINVEKDFDDRLPSVWCIPTEIEQVLFNLMKNAAQAMSETGNDAKKYKISIKTFRLDSAARIEVADNGPGMTEDVRKRVFEPFFTTKSVGVGTGLGLSVSYFIITNNHKGRMLVESAPGEGTKFIIDLPLARNTGRHSA